MKTIKKNDKKIIIPLVFNLSVLLYIYDMIFNAVYTFYIVSYTAMLRFLQLLKTK